MTDTNQKITLLLPCFNKSKYMKRLFTCLLKQKDKNFKIIFLDDKSADNTLYLLNQFKQKYQNSFDIKIIALKKNGGISNARNILIQNVETPYFLFLDPDDFLRQKSIYYFNKKLQEQDYDLVVSKDSLILFGRIWLPNVLSWFDSFKKRHKKLNDMQLAWVENMSPFAWNKAINTKWFRSLNMHFIVGRNYEDIAVVNMAILRSKKMSYIEKTTYRYDVNLDGLTKIHDPKKFADIFLNLNEFYADLEKHKLLNKWRNESNAENKIIGKIFIHLFYSSNNKTTIKNFDSYQSALDIMFPFLEKYEIVNNLRNFTSCRRFVLNDALRNYEKIKKMYYVNKKISK